MRYKLLLVEDHEAIIKGLIYTLSSGGFDTQVCMTKRQAQEIILREIFDLAILDIALPDGDGYEVCRFLKETQPDTPVIFLTAKEEENDIVKGLDIGADDYIIKPFRNRELLSRINSVLRRYHKSEPELVCGGIRMDLGTNRVFRDGEEVTLTALEFKLAVYLFQNQGMVLSRDKILSRIWDYSGEVVNDNTLTVYIKRLREKLGEEHIETVRGMGYRIM